MVAGIFSRAGLLFFEMCVFYFVKIINKNFKMSIYYFFLNI